MHHPMYAKTSTNSLIDYLDPEATRAFLKTTHEAYKKAFGPEYVEVGPWAFSAMSRTFADFTPWTPKMLEEFQERRATNLQPYLPWFFAPEMPEEARRVQADYWDVWATCGATASPKCRSDGAPLTAWNTGAPDARRQPDVGDLRSGRPHQGDAVRSVPGTDVAAPTSPDEVRVYCQAALLGGAPIRQGASVGGERRCSHQRARAGQVSSGPPAAGRRQSPDGQGIDEPARGSGGAPAGQPVPPSPWRSAMAWYGNRASYMMAIGRPAAQIAVYDPATSLYFADEDASRAFEDLTQKLFEHQLDFDLSTRVRWLQW